MDLDRLVIDSNELSRTVQMDALSMSEEELHRAYEKLLAMESLLQCAIEEKKEQLQTLIATRKAKLAYSQGGNV
ncbi:hypothetical protein [Ferroacidibacillus organovorans]|uniref:Uncharacterized protein n=1 Tax=Ferroacidibacillus organovorans TaxID=1765683 RepID=A0A101XQK0_9BACL|nr:hypothetical protein [Ferroacidibacillus organovorans]KUO95697.1 hypothetical protein ATW55_13180 [Ferroacidibacillus organovorans]